MERAQAAFPLSSGMGEGDGEQLRVRAEAFLELIR